MVVLVVKSGQIRQRTVNDDKAAALVDIANAVGGDIDHCFLNPSAQGPEHLVEAWCINTGLAAGNDFGHWTVTYGPGVIKYTFRPLSSAIVIAGRGPDGLPETLDPRDIARFSIERAGGESTLVWTVGA